MPEFLSVVGQSGASLDIKKLLSDALCLLMRPACLKFACIIFLFHQSIRMIFI
jgi:hypothetical protein